MYLTKDKGIDVGLIVSRMMYRFLTPTLKSPQLLLVAETVVSGRSFQVSSVGQDLSKRGRVSFRETRM